MPYWDYRLDYNLPVPLDSILFHVEPFEGISTIQSNEIATNEALNAERLFESATETMFDLYDKTLWLKRKNAYDMLEQLNVGVLWKLMFYVTIENEMDMLEGKKLNSKGYGFTTNVDCQIGNLLGNSILVRVNFMRRSDFLRFYS